MHVGQTEVQLLGFRVWQGLRKCDPSKVQGPARLAGANFHWRFDFFQSICQLYQRVHSWLSWIEVKLRPYCKKGASIQGFWDDTAAVAIIRDLKEALVSSAALTFTQFGFKPHPVSFRIVCWCFWFSWGCTLGQRPHTSQAPPSHCTLSIDRMITIKIFGLLSYWFWR